MGQRSTLGVVSFLLLGASFGVFGNMYDPHVKPTIGPFTEGWYMRLIDTKKGRSFGVQWGYVVPETPKSASNLDFFTVLRSEVGMTPNLQDYNLFPEGKDVKYKVNNGLNVTFNPGIYSPASMQVEVKNTGNINITQNSTTLDLTIGNIKIKMELGAASPWHEDYSGPEGSLLQLLPLPVHWFVFSLSTPVTSYTVTDRVTGRVVEGNSGMVHMEKSWGESFPEKWIWSQGARADPNKVLFAVRQGYVSVLGVEVSAHLAGYRNHHRQLSLDFTPLNSQAQATLHQCGDPITVDLQYTIPFTSRLNMTVTAPLDSFSSCLYGPTVKGYKPASLETYVATAEIRVYEWSWKSSWIPVDHQVISLTALELGGEYTCQPC